MTLTPDHLWNLDEVRQYLGVSRATVLRLHIRFTKIGRARRYDPQDVIAFAEKGMSRPKLEMKESA